MTRHMLGSIMAAMAFLALFAAGPAHSASTPATSLPAAGSIAETDVLLIAQGSTTLRQTTVSALRGYVVGYPDTFTGAVTFTTAPTFSTPLALASGGTGANGASGARTNLGLGSVATYNTGTSGTAVPLLSNSNTFAGDQTITSTDPTTTTYLPNLHVYRNRATPADGDDGGCVSFEQNDSGMNQTAFGQICGFSSTVLNGGEYGGLRFKSEEGGSNSTRWSMGGRITGCTEGGGGLWSMNATGCDQGIGTINVAGGYYVNGVQFQAQTAITWTGKQAFNGHIVTSGGTTPTISSGCGTGATIYGSDNTFRVTLGTTPAGSCTVTFATAYTTGPICGPATDVTAGLTLPMASNPTTTTVTFTVTGSGILGSNGAAAASGDRVVLRCEG